MPKIKVSGVKTYRSKGRTYHYHRATGLRINVDIDQDPELFLKRVRELDANAAALPVAQHEDKKVRTLGSLFDSWKRSEEWGALRAQTQATYERVIAPNRGSLAAVRPRPIVEFTTPFVVGIRDAIKKRRKRWLANYSIKVMNLAFAWGRIHGHCDFNPAKGVPLLPRPADAPTRNRAWAPNEFSTVWDFATPQVRMALALAHYAGMRVGDVVLVPWSAWDGEVLTFRQSKTGSDVHVRAAAPLRAVLNAAAREGVQIVTNERGLPYTRDGLQTNLWKLTKKLEVAGLVEAGLCFHGLRHSLGATLYDLGLDREARKAALGHKSDAASIVYERAGNRRAASDRAFAAFDQHLSTESAKRNTR